MGYPDRAERDPVYDPFSYRLHEDPYPTYAWMREHAPLYRNDARDFWALSRYHDVRWALRDPRLFSSRNGISLEPDLWGPAAAKTSFFLAMDPPEHGKLRRLMGGTFKPRWVATMEPRVRELTRARLAPLRDGPTFDFADFGAAVPNDVMCEVIGIPPADRDAIRADNDLLNHCEDGTDKRSAATVAAGFRLAVYYVNLVNDRRRRRRDGQEIEWIEVALLVRRRADAEMDVGNGELSGAARADRSDGRALDDTRVAGDADRAEVGQAHREPVAGLNGDRHPVRRHRAGEADDTRRRGEHRHIGVGSDRDAAVLPGRVRMRRVERERLEHRPADRPRPRARTRHEDHEQEHDRTQLRQ